MNSITIGFRKEIIADFFLSQFSRRNKHCIELSRSNDIGKFVYSLVKYAAMPPNKKVDQELHNIEVVLPLAYGSTIHCHFPVISKEDQWKANDYVTAIFNLKFQQYLIMGEKLNMQQKNIIELFLKNHNLDTDKYAALKKKDYRMRVGIENEIDKIVKVLAS